MGFWWASGLGKLSMPIVFLVTSFKLVSVNTGGIYLPEGCFQLGADTLSKWSSILDLESVIF